MIYAYVLQSWLDGEWYTGLTNDLRKRFMLHNHEKVYVTKRRMPFDLVYDEACVNDHDARAREKFLKTGMDKRFLKNWMKRFLSLTG